MSTARKKNPHRQLQESVGLLLTANLKLNNIGKTERETERERERERERENQETQRDAKCERREFETRKKEKK